MSFLNKIFQTVPVKIPDRSGFDLSHEVLTTAKTGTVVPITHFEVLPGDTISMGSMMKVTLPPFAVPFMGRIDAELTAAFIPNRLLWQGWQAFITQNNGVNTVNNTAGNTSFEGEGNYNNVPISVPVVNALAEVATGTNFAAYYGPGSLLDYLGFKTNGAAAGTAYISALPFLAYHKFCDDWIRDENNMKPFFPKVFNQRYNTSGGSNYANTLVDSVAGSGPHILPFESFPGTSQAPGSSSVNVFSLSTKPESTSSSAALPFDPFIALGDLRQRCWAKDYFTTATTRPQAGAAASVTFDTSGNSGNFTISTLRAANSLQKWLERNNIAGTEYGSQILAHFGVTPPDAVLNRSVLLGSVRTPVVVSSVANNSGAAQESTSNPYGSVLGSAAGFGSGFEKGSLVDNFTVKEHGFIMVFFTLIPHSYYNTGWNRALYHKSFGDFAWPEFANIGDQAILVGELNANSPSTQSNTFGYNQRYSEYKFLPDRISGLLRDGENLSAYALQRGFSDTPALGKEFLEIPTDFLDQVLGVSSAVGGFGCIVDAFFDCKALRVLPEYSLPSL